MARQSKKDEIEKLERELADLQRMARPEIPSDQLDRVRGEVAQLRRDFYEHIGAWQRTLLARHPQRQGFARHAPRGQVRTADFHVY
jgi:acetyl-CoA carboxylase alpha subunit